MNPKFSIIVPHYDGVISDEQFLQGMNSLVNQTYRDFEILVYHDGPISRPIPNIDFPNVKIKVTEKRFNDWGHSLRDMGIREAQGEYILHFNPDNILYKNALESIFKQSQKQYFYNKDGIEYIYPLPNDIIIFPILMRGVQSNGVGLWRNKKNAEKDYMIFTGYPPLKYNIDCMQLVMKRSLWIENDGWKDKSEDSDGNMYEPFVQKYKARYCSEVLGEHR